MIEELAKEELLDLDYVRIDASVALSVPETLAIRRRVLLFGRDERNAYAAVGDPNDQVALEALERIAGVPVIAQRAEPASLDRALSRIFHRRTETRSDDAIRIVEEILHAALLEQASDVHFESAETHLGVRFRVDGVLEPHREISLQQAASVMNRVKVQSGMDIAERRVPQDGRFTYTAGTGAGKRSVDVRVAVMPTKFGERATLRLLALRAEVLTLLRLGMNAQDLARFRAAVNADHGLVLLTGPTGSGKSTTLYAALSELDLATQNVLTIEDPIEYDLPGASQIEVDQGDRVSFARALRSMLRHDPDVIMIGEIRDAETADVAVKASLTGHLVLSTLHTNSALSSVTRLVDMGVPAYLVAATLRSAVAQRLVRRLCTHCSTTRALLLNEAIALGDASAAGQTVRVKSGCAYCKRSGYAGRVGLFESFAPDQDMSARIAAGANEIELAHAARALGASSLRDDARAKVLSGVTSVDEALRAMEVW
jgi:general secretion pathway protein E